MEKEIEEIRKKLENATYIAEVRREIDYLLSALEKAEEEVRKLEGAIIGWKIVGGVDKKRIKQLEEEIEKLKGLIAEAGPLAWITNDDIYGAAEWEKKAFELIGGEAK